MTARPTPPTVSPPAASPPATAAQRAPEKLIFEIKQLLLPTILNYEILTILGFTVIIMISAVTFHLGPWEMVIIGVLFFLIALPSFMAIFQAGSTTYALTNQRMAIFTVGVRSRERSIPLGQIQDVKCKRSVFQRLFGAGDLIIYQKSLRRPVRLLGIKDCEQRADQINQAVKRHRRTPAS